MKKSVLVIGLALICCGIGLAQTTIFSDDCTSFPTGWTLSPSSGWTKTTSRYNSASSAARCDDISSYANGQNNYMTRPVSLSGYTSATLKFYIWQYTESGYDYVYLQYYSGSAWTTAWSRAGSYQSWSQQSVTIPTTATQIRFWFKSDASVVYEGAYLDDIALTATSSTATPTLAVSMTSWSPAAAGGTSAAVSVTNSASSSTIAYTVSSSQSWLTVSSTSGTTPGSFSMTAAANSGSTSRSATVTVTATTSGVSGSPKTITVSQSGSSSSTPAKIVCFDVGQGDATFIQSPTGKYVLIDGGPSSTMGTKVWKFLRDSVRTHHVDYIFISHFHEDHIGGLPAAIDSIKKHGIDSIKGGIYDHGGTYSSAVFTNYTTSAGTKRMTPTMGQVFDLGGGMTIKVVSMNGQTISGGSITPGSEENNNSLGLLVSYNGFKMVVASDIAGYNSGSYKDQESILAPGVGSVNVLYVNHHGSSTSSNPTWISTLDPQASIISCGNGNSYGHPTAAALTRLTADPGANNYIYQTETGSGGTIPSGRGRVVNGNIWVTINAANYTIGSTSYGITKGGDYLASLATPAALPAASDFAVTSVYPNPVRNGRATISYQMKSSGLVTIELYNMLGQKVQTLVNGYQQAGAHSLAWDGNADRSRSLANGVYFCRMAVMADGQRYDACSRFLMVK